jgi:hypothetical protein
MERPFLECGTRRFGRHNYLKKRAPQLGRARFRFLDLRAGCGEFAPAGKGSLF